MKDTKPGRSYLMIHSNFIKDKLMITIEIPQDAFVSLKVYSMLGKETAQFIEMDFSSGKHTVELNRKNLTKRTYIFSMKAGKLFTSRKMVLYK